MKRTTKILAVLASFGFVLTLAAPILAQLKSPDTVKTALRLLVQVSNDFKRQIANKNFARVPHEYMEYTEAADALRGAIKDEPADFKAKEFILHQSMTVGMPACGQDGSGIGAKEF